MSIQAAIFWSSQTGCSQEIARQIYDRAKGDALRSCFAGVELSLVDSKTQKSLEDITRFQVIVIVTSSTGDGDPPDNAIQFTRILQKEKKSIATLPTPPPFLPFHRIHFTLLGLGDTNYSTFQGHPKRIWQLFRDLGATPFHERGEVDEVKGLEEQVEPWIDSLWISLSSTLSALVKAESTKEGDVVSDVPLTHHQEVAVPKKKKLVFKKKPSVSSSLSGQNAEDPKSPISLSSRLPQLPLPTLSAKTVRDTIVRINSQSSSAEWKSDLSVDWIHRQLQLQNHCNSLDPYFPHSILHPEERDRTFSFLIQQAKWLTDSRAIKQVLELTLDLSDSVSVCQQQRNSVVDQGLVYFPGDAMGIYPINPSASVFRLLWALKLHYDDSFAINSGVSTSLGLSIFLSSEDGKSVPIGLLLERRFDLSMAPKKSLLKFLGDCCSDPKEKETLYHLSSASGRKEFSELFQTQRKTVVDLLEEFPSSVNGIFSIDTNVEVLGKGDLVELSNFSQLLSHLPPMKPRYYSFCSALVDPTQPPLGKIAFTVVDQALVSGGNKRFRGVATNFLQSQVLPDYSNFHRINPYNPTELAIAASPAPLFSKQQKLFGFYRPSIHFRLPEDASRPIIMIGPGTGVAPFIGFLHYRRQQLKQASLSSSSSGLSLGESWLFFGCRHPDLDFLFREELESFVADGSLTHLQVAYSRLDPNKVEYVQHKMQQFSSKLYHLIKHKDAVIFVCG